MEDISDGLEKPISKPPLNYLFNPTLVEKKQIWEIKISSLLDLLLTLITKSGKKDLRICGIAAWSSSVIYRLKVESIFNLEKIAMKKKSIDLEYDIPELDILDYPFRITSTYPISLEDLVRTLENMISDLANPKIKNKKALDLEPLNESFNFDQYFIKFEEIIEQYQAMVLDILGADGIIKFSELTKNMTDLEIARAFISILYLAMSNKIEINVEESSNEISIIHLK